MAKLQSKKPATNKPAPKSSAGRTPARKKANVGKVVKVLSALEQKFVDEYIVDYNAMQAAIRAGYAPTTAEKKSFLWVGKSRTACPPNKRHIWDAVDKARTAQQQRTEITADRVLKECARLAFFDPRKLFDDEGRPLAIHMLDDATAAAIAGIEVCTKGNAEMGIGEVIKYKVSDKNSAMEKLFKHLGLYELDNHQKTDPLAALLERIAGGNSSKFSPVADDPEHEEE